MVYSRGDQLMHFFPFHKNKQWQRFFAGLLIGAIISYTIFIYMFGQLLEKRIEENLELRTENQELHLTKRTLTENLSDLNQKYQAELFIQSIAIIIANAEELKLDRFSVLELEELIHDEVSDIVGSEIKTFQNHYPLLIRTVENKTFNVNHFSYHAEVRHLFINEQSEIHVELTVDR